VGERRGVSGAPAVRPVLGGHHAAREGCVMAAPLIAITGLIYAYVAADLAWQGKHGLALAYAGYAFSNIGLYLAAR
jgi:hypothetical protein